VGGAETHEPRRGGLVLAGVTFGLSRPFRALVFRVLGSQGVALGCDGSGLWPWVCVTGLPGVGFPGRCPGLRWVRPLALGLRDGSSGCWVPRALPWAAMGQALGLGFALTGLPGVGFPGRCPGLRWVRPWALGLR
jgi:hypothetical protein